jgi:hypothetical protein
LPIDDWRFGIDDLRCVIASTDREFETARARPCLPSQQDNRESSIVNKQIVMRQSAIANV